MTLATAIGISDLIIQFYSNSFKKDKSLFSNLSGAKGMCAVCSGIGIIVFGADSQSQITLKCKDCRGTGFSNKLAEHTIAGKNIQDVWQMTIDEAAAFFSQSDKKIFTILHNAQKLLLGHLQIGEKTQLLSGGENIRIKLMTVLSSKKRTIGIDEPFKGLNNEEIYSVALSLNELAGEDKTIFVADHEESAHRYFSNQIVISNDKGILRGNNLL